MASQKSGYRMNTCQKKTWKNLKKNKKGAVNLSKQLTPQPFGDMTKCDWFWKNYYMCIGWREQHHIAYWKSRALALEYENNILNQYLQMYAFNEENRAIHLTSNGIRKTAGQKRTLSSKTPKRDEQIIVDRINNRSSERTKGTRKMTAGQERSNQYYQTKGDSEHVHGIVDYEDNDEEGELVFEVTEEMMDFLEQSMRHKMERQEARKNAMKMQRKMSTDSDVEEKSCLPPKKQVGSKRQKEMKLLYGEAAPMIIAMETAMQLAFDRNFDLNQPKIWPIIALKM